MPKGSYTAGGKTSLPKKVSDRMRKADRMKSMDEAIKKMRGKMGPRRKGKDSDPFTEGQAGSITTKKAMGGMAYKRKGK
jgi:hypothetical protein